MNRNKTIKDIFNDFIDRWAEKRELSLKLGTASNIDVDSLEFDFTPNDGGSIIVGCQMQVSKDNAGSVIFIPKAGSLVLIGFVAKADPHCLFVSEAEEILFNGGDNQGLVIVGSITEKLNNLENKVNSLISFINSHVHTSAAPGSPTTPPVPTFTGGTLTPTQQEDIENEKVKH